MALLNAKTLIIVREAGDDDRQWGLQVVTDEWHSPLIERADEFIDVSNLPWLVAEIDGDRVGLATLLFGPDFLEIITIKSLVEGKGVGSALIANALSKAQDLGLRDLRLFTTNDNLDALGFYQKRGFRIHAIHKGSMTRARILKPSIPLVGHYGIKICDEIELRIQLHDFVTPR